MEHFGLDRYFRFIAGSELDNSRDRKVDVIYRAMTNIDYAYPENTVMIGDRAYDMEAAKEAGIRRLGVTYGYGTEEELIRAGAEAVADAPSGIYGALRKLYVK